MDNYDSRGLVVERFLKSIRNVWGAIVGQNRITAHTALEPILTETTDNLGIVTGYPTFEAIIDVFKPVHEAVILF